MTITAVFEDINEVKAFAEMFQGMDACKEAPAGAGGDTVAATAPLVQNIQPQVQNAPAPVQPPVQNAQVSVQPPVQNAQVSVQPPVQNARVSVQPPAQNAQAPVQPPVQNAQAQPAAAVPVTAAQYTLDDLARAGMTLMDAGRQADLQGLLSRFGVEALPMLEPGQYGAFATTLREMGAQI